MATIHLRASDGNDADSGLTWALAKATWAGAVAAMSPGDRLLIAHTNAENNTSTTTFTSPGTAALPCEFISVDSATDIPTPGAEFTLTGTSVLSVEAGFGYWYGIAFRGSTSSSTVVVVNIGHGSLPFGHVFDDCTFDLRGTNGTPKIFLGQASLAANTDDDASVTCDGCTFLFNHADHYVGLRNGHIDIRGGSVAPTGTVPASGAYAPVLATQPNVRIVGVDLSTVSGPLVNVAAASPANIRLERCRLHASATEVTGTNPGPGGPMVEFYNCGSGVANYTNGRHHYRGAVATETTIVKTGGASDGTTPVSWKMVTSANVKMWDPLYSFEVSFFEAGTGSKSYGIEVVTDNVTLTDAQAWVEVVYGVSASHPLAGFGSDRAATVLTAPTNQASSSVAWTTTGLTTPVKQRLETTVTVAMAGRITLRVALARPSTTMYLSPDVVMDGAREWMTPGVYVNEGLAAAAGGGLRLVGAGGLVT